MEKRDFEAFIKENLKNLPLEEQEEILNSIGSEWLPAIKDKLNRRIEKSYYKCSKCGRYSLKKRFKTSNGERLVKGVTVYSDAGYGDDDEIADITYSVKYLVCPFCNGLTEQSKYPLVESNRRSRR